jgi:hypothetical protein
MGSGMFEQRMAPVEAFSRIPPAGGLAVEHLHRELLDHGEHR